MTPPTVPDERDDRALIRDHVAGDPTAFTELVRRHRDRLWAVAVRTTCGDREEAADALQDALISAFRNAASYRGDAAVTTWLHRVVVNACLDRLRRRQVRPTTPLDRDVTSGRDDHGAAEARIDVWALLRALPEAQRTAIVLVDLEEMSVAEAAEYLGVAVGTVKSRCSRGRAAMAEILRPGEVQDPGNRPVRPRVAPHEGGSHEPAAGSPDDPGPADGGRVKAVNDG